MKVVSVVGARPQFVKAAAVSRRLRERHHEVLVHTGQHYDPEMSALFFEELQIPEPDIRLDGERSAGRPGTGRLIAALSDVLTAERPDVVLVYGDTRSTIAAAVAAARTQVPIAHVEAGLRSYNPAMPEEINRVVTDHLSTLLFCPSPQGVENLRVEGITAGVHLVGDVMGEALAHALGEARYRSSILTRLDLEPGSYLLATVHRPENADNPNRLRSILRALEVLDETVIFPVHPRTHAALQLMDFEPPPGVRLIEPVGYLDMVMLQTGARLVLTDSGSMQKEAYWLGVPCVTLRAETEWVETVATGWNVLAGADTQCIVEAARTIAPVEPRPSLYAWEGATDRIVEILDDAAWLPQPAPAAHP